MIDFLRPSPVLALINGELVNPERIVDAMRLTLERQESGVDRNDSRRGKHWGW